MPTRRRKQKESKESKIHVPPSKKREIVAGIGVEQPPEAEIPLRVTPKYAGNQSSLFPKGGEAFANWCEAKGISAKEQRSSKEWEALLKEFADRPIHGLRRGESGGTHTPNPSDLRG